jgi:hypothetical protein
VVRVIDAVFDKDADVGNALETTRMMVGAFQVERARRGLDAWPV